MSELKEENQRDCAGGPGRGRPKPAAAPSYAKGSGGSQQCVLNGHTNTANNRVCGHAGGFILHKLPKTGLARSEWIDFIEKCVSDFKPNDRKPTFLCSGHFDRSQYDQAQVRMFHQGMRKFPPRLLSTAVPYFEQAIQPFPPDWFIRPELQLQAQTSDSSALRIVSLRLDRFFQKDSVSKKHLNGNRCELNGCNNGCYEGFTVHRLPKEKGSIRRRWIKFIKNSGSSFNADKRKNAYVCSGHFDRSQYDQSHLRMFQYGLRSKPPELLPTAVPHIKKATQPFPLEWFVGPEVQAKFRAKRSSCGNSVLMTSSVVNSDSNSTTIRTRKLGERKERPLSKYARKKEVERILEMYEKKKKEELKAREARRASEVNNDNLMQSTPLMVSHKSEVRCCDIEACGKQVECVHHAEGHCKKETGASENQESLQIEENQISYIKDPLDVYIKEEVYVLSSDDGDGCDKNDDQEALLQREENQINHNKEGDCIDVDINEEVLSCSGVGSGEIDRERASLELEQNIIKYIEEVTSAEIFLREEVITTSCFETEKPSAALSSPTQTACYDGSVLTAPDSTPSVEDVNNHDEISDVDSEGWINGGDSPPRDDEELYKEGDSFSGQDKNAAAGDITDCRTNANLYLQHGEEILDGIVTVPVAEGDCSGSKKIETLQHEQHSDCSGCDPTSDMRMHEPKKSFVCPYCSTEKSSQSHLIRHMRTHTGEKPFQCLVCSKKFMFIKNLKQHTRVHRGVKPHCCIDCYERFEQRCDLNRHMRIRHKRKDKVKSFICSHCSREFFKKSRLDRHIKTHNKERPFQCPICLNEFMCGENLKQHMSFHKERKPFQCSDCHERFTRNSSLKAHMSIHSGEKPFQCSECSVSFRLKSSLTRHLRTHSR